MPELTEGFDWSSIEEEPDFVEDEQNVEEPVEPVTEPETEVPEEGAEAEQVKEQPAPVKRPLTPEEQSFKDKYYDSIAKLEALQHRVLTAGDEISPKSPPEEDLEEVIKAHWGDDPALMKLAQGYKQMQAKIQEQEQYEVQNTAQTVYQTIENFAKSNAEQFKNTEIADRFFEDISDRLNIRFDTVVNQALAGKKFDKQFITSLPGKLERAYAVATGKKSDPVKMAKADENIKKRAAKPSGVDTKAAGSQSAQTPSPSRSSYREALAQARYGSGRK